jgi:hypothetical protein
MIRQVGLSKFFVIFTFAERLWDFLNKTLHILHASKLNLSNKYKRFQYYKLKDVVVIFREAFSCDPSIRPSVRSSVMSSIHGWHHTRKKTLVKINNPPSTHVLLFRKGMPNPRGHPQDFDINISNKPNIYSP